MKIDAYSATVRGSVDHVLGELVAASDLGAVRPSRAFHGYQHGAQVHRGDRVLAQVLWGGNGGGVHVSAMGQESGQVAHVLRHHFPGHPVTRLDAAEDYIADGAFDQLSGLALEVADKHRCRVYHAGDWHRAEEGRTIYVGSSTSVAQARVYEKGKQLGGDPNWVRVELVARPKRPEARVAFSQMQPVEVFGVSKWSRELGERLSGQEIERIRAGSLWRAPDLSRARSAIIRQYGPLLGAWADEVGGWERLGQVLGAEIEAHELAKLKPRGV